MPAKSPEAIARKNAKKRARRAEKGMAVIAAFKILISKTSHVYRRQFAAPHDMSKNELRGLITQAVRNTAELSI